MTQPLSSGEWRAMTGSRERAAKLRVYQPELLQETLGSSAMVCGMVALGVWACVGVRTGVRACVRAVGERGV